MTTPMTPTTRTMRSNWTGPLADQRCPAAAAVYGDCDDGVVDCDDDCDDGDADDGARPEGP